MADTVTRKHWLMVAAAVLISAVLQFWALGHKSLWVDELATVNVAAQDDIGTAFRVFRSSEHQPPLHYLLLYTWVRVSGSGDTAVRVPSSVFSVASVIVIWWLGKMLFEKRTGVIASFLLATSPFLLLFGRMARYFAMAMFFALLSTALLVRALKREDTGQPAGWAWLSYSFAAVAMLFSNYVNVGVFAAQQAFVFAYFIWRRSQRDLRSPLKEWALSLAGISVVFGAWMTIEFSRVSGFGSQASPFNVSGWRETVLAFLYPPYAYGFGGTIFPWHPLAIVLLLAFIVIAISAGKGLRSAGPWGLLFPAIVVANLAAAWAAFGIFVKDLQFEPMANRSIGAFPFFVLMAGLGISRLRQTARTVVLIAIFAAWSFAAYNYFNGKQFHQPLYAVPMREIASMVSDRAGPDELIVADVDSGFSYYFERLRGVNETVDSQPEEKAVDEIRTTQPTRVWLITLGRDRTRLMAPSEVERTLDRGFKLIRTWGYVPQDSFYRKVKERAQGFTDFRYKVTVRLYQRQV